MNDFEIRERLKAAVKNVPVPPDLPSKVSASIAHPGSLNPSWRAWVSGIAAAVVLTLGGSTAYELGYLRPTKASQDSYIAGISARVSAVMAIGLCDHVHCAVFRKYPASPPTGKFVADLGPAYKELLPVVSERTPSGYQLAMAHQCSYDGRGFVHVTFKSGSNLVSLVIANRGEGETIGLEGSVAQAHVQRFEIAGLQTSKYLIYVVSDLPRDRNREIMASLAAPVSAVLKRIEG